MRRGLAAHKRKTRRISNTGVGRRGRSVSPRPSLNNSARRGITDSEGHPQPAPPVSIGHRKASSAPSSPVKNSAIAGGDNSCSAGGNPWDNNQHQQGVSSSPFRTGRNADGAPGEAPPPGSQQRQSSEPTMGTMLTEWFQKLFAPNEGGGDGIVGGGGTGVGGTGEGKPSGSAAAAAALSGASGATDDITGGMGDSTDFPSTKTSAESDIRPPSPPRETGVATSADAATATAAAASGPKGGAEGATTMNGSTNGVTRSPQEPKLKTDTPSTPSTAQDSTAISLDAGAAAASAAAAGETGAAAEEGEGASGGGAAAAANADTSGPALSPRFLGIFARGFGGGGRDKKDKQQKQPDIATAAEVGEHAEGGKTGGGYVGKQTTEPGQAECGGIEAGDDSAGAASLQATATGDGKISSSSGNDDNKGPDNRCDGPTPTAVVSADTPAAQLAGGAGAAGEVAAAAAAGATGAGAEARATARYGGGGSGGSTSRSTSPSRPAALSVGSDDGEEENLYTAGTHQGARPSIDDFSSLRVLGKGSYGKVSRVHSVQYRTFCTTWYSCMSLSCVLLYFMCAS